MSFGYPVFCSDDLQDLLLDGIALSGRLRVRCGRAVVVNEADDVRQRRIVAEFPIFVARDVIGFTNRCEYFRLLHRVDAEVGFQIEVQVQHVLRIAGLLRDDLQDFFLDWIGSGWLRRGDCYGAPPR